MMIVYIEYVLINNFVIDYLLLKATFKLTGKTVSNWRLLFCAFLGACFALFYPLITVNKIITTLCKILFGVLLVFIAGKKLTAKSCYINSLIFFTFTFLTGGALTGIYNLFELNYSDEYLTALTFIPVYFILLSVSNVIAYLYKRRHVIRCTVDVELFLGEKSVVAVGFFDTGNGLYDGDSPVIFSSKELVKNLITFRGLKLKKLTVNTVNGQKEHTAIKLDKIKIYIKDKPHIFNNVTLCVSADFYGDGYDVILHPSLMEGNNASRFEEEIEKVS